ncbi:MAG: cytochrome c [Candidatus Latescibacteria bacterium]|nr:cytochrome c [Candidatus Latescibacterota bacterium]
MMMARSLLWVVVLGALSMPTGGCRWRSSELPRLSIAQVASARVRDTAFSPVERGRFVYQKYGCAMCHGPDGQGGIKNPNSQTGGEIPKLIYVAEGYTVDELKVQILNGVWEIARSDSLGPRPPYRMPAIEWMSPEELDALVQYMMSLMPKGAEEKW